MSQTYASNDFNSIMDSLVLYLRNQSEFKDFDFDGSAIRELLRVLAYNAQQQAFQNNFVYNELQLDSAQLRQNVTSLASRLGYTPSSKTAASFKTNIIVRPSIIAGAPPSLLLDRDTQFYATKDGKTFIFSPDIPYVANLNDGLYTFNNVNLLQGIWTVNAFRVSSQYANDSYVLPNNSMDTNTLEIAVRTSETSGDQVIYNQFKTAYDLGANSNLYFLRENRDGFFEFKFGDGKFAKRLSVGNIITTRYLVSNGIDGNDLTGFSPASSIGGFYDITLTSIDTKSAGGADQEDIESIRTLAPITFAAAGNAVTPGDYVALAKKLYPNILDAISWGGEVNIPKRYGYVYLSILPKSGELLTDTQKSIIVDLLSKYNVASITPVIVDPIYTYINVNTNIKYRPSALAISLSALNIKIRDYCNIFSKEKLEKFGGALDMSRLSEFMNNIDLSIQGNSTSISYEKRFVPILNVNSSYLLDFAHSIEQGSVKISNFEIADVAEEGWIYSMVDVNGSLNIIRTKDDSVVTLITNVGGVDYINGVITVNTFKPSMLTDNYIKVECSSPLTEDQSLVGIRNSILKINTVNINLLAVTN